MKAGKLIKLMTGAASALAVTLCLSSVAIGAKPPNKELGFDHPRVKQVIAVHDTVKSEIMAMQDVIGTAVSNDDNGEPAIVVYVNTKGKNPAHSVRNVPGNYRGENVIVELTEPFRALATSVALHRSKQTPPIQLGTSGGWGYDLANGYCCGGTLGSLIQVGTTQYVMSNYHVFESDIVSGGNKRTATTGDPIMQPGLIDVACNAGNAQAVATLNKLSSLPGSNVDVSIAQATAGKVRTDGAILEIGTLSKNTVAASIGKTVKKSGRTTGLTSSYIKGLNATISVTYANECAGGTAFTKTFTGQILVNNPSSTFLAGGDSGSLLVENVATNPRAIGLLFAGSNTLAVANPINDVLTFISGKLGGTATMVGK